MTQNRYVWNKEKCLKPIWVFAKVTNLHNFAMMSYYRRPAWVNPGPLTLLQQQSPIMGYSVFPLTVRFFVQLYSILLYTVYYSSGDPNVIILIRAKFWKLKLKVEGSQRSMSLFQVNFHFLPREDHITTLWGRLRLSLLSPQWLPPRLWTVVRVQHRPRSPDVTLTWGREKMSTLDILDPEIKTWRLHNFQPANQVS